MKERAREIILKSWPDQDFDHLGLIYFNLKSGEKSFLEFHQGVERSIENFYFDLASMTKALTMGALACMKPELFKEEKRLLLEHRGGLPRWAILGKKSWKETVLKFPIKESPTEYSDLSMLRLMLILEEEQQKTFKELVDGYWHSELCFWKDLPENALCPDTGFRQGAVINGEVNDDNCFKINRFCSHAGLFGTLLGVFESLNSLEKNYNLLDHMNRSFKDSKVDRYLFGWDTVEDPTVSLAGIGCPPQTFGHLGFTGTSVWIDADSGKGWCLLTNSTKKYWYHRGELTKLRQSLGALLWK
ncbi:MAG: beta-lactamase family protein [Bacteriovoracaceae bacterium]|nr:beta-lactamase family protein [Bacteriovoracaceae bacterium]